MKNLFRLICLLPILCFGQKITIDPELVVGKTHFEIAEYSGGDYRDAIPYRATIILDKVSKDSTYLYIGTQAYAQTGLEITFKNNAVIPKLYHWDDGGGGTTKLDFDTYELELSSSYPAIGETLRGKFTGVATQPFYAGGTRKLRLSGKFSYIIENSPTLPKNRHQTFATGNPENKRYLATGFYRISNTDDGMRLKMPTYALFQSEKEFYVHNTRVNDGMLAIEQAVAVPDSKNPKLTNLKLIIAPAYLANNSLISMTEKCALIIDDNLIYVDFLPQQYKGAILLPIAFKNKQEANTIAQKINTAIQKDKKGRKK